MAAIIAKNFFTALTRRRATSSLLAFAAGFAVRPFGAIVFGRLGDLVGRRQHLPGHDPDHRACPPPGGLPAQLLRDRGHRRPRSRWISLRLLQGLALGGEYGGAGHPCGRARAATAGAVPTRRGSRPPPPSARMLALMVILGTRLYVGEKEFSLGLARAVRGVGLLLAVSVWIRLKLCESPRSEDEVGRQDLQRPLTESFGQWGNLKMVILALVGLTAGQAVVWHTGQFYALFFPGRPFPEGRRPDRQHPDRAVADHRHAVLLIVRFAVGQDRSQADHHGWLPAGGADLLPLFRRPDPLRQPQARRRRAQSRPSWCRRPRRPARPDPEPHRHGCSSPPATWPAPTWPTGRQLRQGGRRRRRRDLGEGGRQVIAVNATGRQRLPGTRSPLREGSA